MPNSQDQPHPENAPASLFPNTRWSVVLAAQGDEDSKTQRALEELCQNYWYPIYAYVRRKGLAAHDAEDRTQAFFQHIFSKRVIDSANPEKGKLRAFLLASLNNFLAKQWRDQHTQKRGGQAVHFSIDLGLAEELFAGERDSDADADLLFDRVWAHALLQTVFARLEEHYKKTNAWETYLALRPALQGDGKYGEGKEIAERLKLSPEGVRSAVFKLRRRFRDYVEEEVRDTCARPEDARNEIRYLCMVLAES